jgi:type II secretory pathway pseudopilin PulG
MGTKLNKKSKRRCRKARAFTLTEVVVASGLLVVAMVPILRGLTAAHFGARIIEKKTASLSLAQTKLDEIKVRSIYNYSGTYAETNTDMGNSYLCSVTVSAIGANLKNITVDVGHDNDGNSVLAAGEISVTLETLIAKRW